ncbi:hypothetical protein C8A05DRAFT_17398 [Staphylotrichum tortipilum]|uniref:Uncharacterized protein n=1 Tax=Staphylotrichum tortipilum TaxID=2831512 RepID=A0AAN6MHZ5_9PEZI|nr:hypothetical protein C8A05DRAFT_17398 [Staphylotrichum longicolle]
MSARRPFDMLPQVVNEVLVTTAKAFKAARPDGKGNSAGAVTMAEARIPAAVEKFNAILDELECEILLSKSIHERDLRELRANRQPPQPEPKPVAPPAPMIIDVESPKMNAKEPFTGLPGPPGAPASGNANMPVAPFPNMGFGGTSPEVATAPTPKMTAKPKDVKGLARLGVAAAGLSRPASAPPKKEAKISAQQARRPSSEAGGPPAASNGSVQAKAASLLATNKSAPAPALGNGPGSVAAATTASTAVGNEKLFTGMTFSLAPASTDAPVPTPTPQPRAAQQQAQLQGPDLTSLGTGDGFNAEQFTTGPANVANMGGGAPQGGKPAEEASMDNVDAKIDGLFDLGPGSMESMDIGYDLDNADNSNFNDMYFDSGDNGGAGEFDNAFFNLNG